MSVVIILVQVVCQWISILFLSIYSDDIEYFDIVVFSDKVSPYINMFRSRTCMLMFDNKNTSFIVF